MLPIGDNYTMGPDDALRAVKLLRPKMVIPVHYNTWEVIAQDPHKPGRFGLKPKLSPKVIVLAPVRALVCEDSVFGKMDQETKRLPPGQHLTDRFPVLHYGLVPRLNLETWNFRVWGEVEQPLLLTWEEFSSLPRTRLHMDIHCVTTWSKLDTSWEGVSLKTLRELGLVVPKPERKSLSSSMRVRLYCQLAARWMDADNFLLATHYEGQQIGGT